MRYWINTISFDHVQRGVAGGFTQANHGRNTGLRKLSRDDWLIFYSPKADYEGTELLQCFTAIGQVTDDEPHRFEMTPDFIPWRRTIAFLPCQQVPIRPMIDRLSFITDTKHWGYMFRFGLFEIPEADFQLIRSAMVEA